MSNLIGGYSQRRNIHRLRRGMTLTELLLVILILSLLVAAGLPLMKNNMQERKLREGSRMLNAIFASAKSNAAALGRPVGVWLDRTPGLPYQCIEVTIAETPPIFMGAFDNSQARVNPTSLSLVDPETGSPYNIDEMAVQFSDPLDMNLLGNYLVASGHLSNTGSQEDFERDAQFWIKFNFRGPWYSAIAKWDSNHALVTFIRDYSNGCSVNEIGTQGCTLIGVGQRFQIRLPPQRGLGDPMQLPAGTAVDLQFSGYDSFGTEISRGIRPNDPSPPTEPLIIMFNPNGSIQNVYGVATQPLSFVHLLLGDTERIVAYEDTAMVQDNEFYANTNAKSVENYWVSVGNLTGNVVTSENASSTVDNFSPQSVADARRFANAASSMGGR